MNTRVLDWISGRTGCYRFKVIREEELDGGYSRLSGGGVCIMGRTSDHWGRFDCFQAFTHGRRLLFKILS